MELAAATSLPSGESPDANGADCPVTAGSLDFPNVSTRAEAQASCVSSVSQYFTPPPSRTTSSPTEWALVKGVTRVMSLLEIALTTACSGIGPMSRLSPAEIPVASSTVIVVAPRAAELVSDVVIASSATALTGMTVQ